MSVVSCVMQKYRHKLVWWSAQASLM